MIRDGQPSPEQARRMAKIFIIATLLGGLMVFLNVTMRSYNIRLQQAELKSKEAASAGHTAPTGQPSSPPVETEAVPSAETSNTGAAPAGQEPKAL